VKRARKPKPKLQNARKFAVFAHAAHGIAFVAGYRLESKANARHHWRTAATVTEGQRDMGQRMGSMLPRALPCTVTLTRLGKGTLDEGGNLEHAFKAIRDGIADVLVGKPTTVMRKGRETIVMRGNDSDPRITWVFKQERGDYAIEARVNR
jgi:hypothetical protein